MSQDVTALPDFDAKWNFGDPAASEKAFREIEEQTKATAGSAYRAGLLTQIARAQGLQRQFDAAHQTLDQVEAMLTDAMPSAESSTVRVRYLLERGRVFNSSSDKAKAKPLFADAWAMAKDDATLTFYAVDAAHMLGIVEEPDAALAWNEKAIAHAEQSDSEKAKKWLGSLYNNTGWTYHDKGEFDKAMVLFRKALDWFEQHGGEPQIRIALWTIARCHRSLKQFNEALVIQRSLEAAMEKSGEPDGFVYEEIAELLLAQGQTDVSKPYFGKAFEVLSKDEWFKANEAERLERMRTLGQ